MDPFTIYRIGRIRQQEILAWAEKAHSGNPARRYLSTLGGLLIRVGEKMVDATGPAPDAHTSAKHC